MLSIPPDFARLYDTLLEQEDVAVKQRPHYQKWLRYYLDFCHKYSFEPTDRQSFPAFDEKLRAKNQSQWLRQQAYHAISLYYQTVVPDSRATQDKSTDTSVQTTIKHPYPSVKEEMTAPHTLPRIPANLTHKTNTANLSRPSHSPPSHRPSQTEERLLKEIGIAQRKTQSTIQSSLANTLPPINFQVDFCADSTLR